MKNTLEVKTNELEKVKEELEMTKSTNLTLSNRIEELEMEKNKVSDQKKSVKKSKSMEKKISFKSSVTVFAPDDHFPQNSDLTRHINVVHEKKKTSKLKNETTAGKKYACEICKRVFNDIKNRKRHIRTVHEGKKPYICNMCKTAYGQSDGLKKHISSFHNKEKPFKCKLCSASYSRKYDLTHHEKKLCRKQS